MRVSELLQSGVDEFLELTPSVKAHLADTDNPHAFTSDQLPNESITGEKLAKGAVSMQHLASPLADTIQNKVDKEEGKVLSQNDFTDACREKLASIPADALVQTGVPLDEKDLKGRFERIYDDMVFADVKEFISAFYEDSCHTLHIAYLDKDNVYTVKRFYAMSTEPAMGTNPLATDYPETVTVTGPVYTPVIYGDYTAGGVCHAVTKDATYICMWVPGSYKVYKHDTKNGDGEAVLIGSLSLQYAVNNDSFIVQDLLALSDGGLAVISVLTNPDCVLTEVYDRNFNLHSFYTANSLYYRGKKEESEAMYDYYNRHFKMAAADREGNIYLSPVCNSSQQHLVSKFDREGSVVDNLCPFVLDGQTFDNAMTDITLLGDRLYGWTQSAVYSISSNGVGFPIFSGLDYENNRLRGISPRRDGRVFLAMRNKSANTNTPSKTILSCVDARILTTSMGGEQLEGQTAVSEDYDIVRLFGDEIWGFLFDADAMTLTVHKYQYKKPFCLEAADNV